MFILGDLCYINRYTLHLQNNVTLVKFNYFREVHYVTLVELPFTTLAELHYFSDNTVHYVNKITLEELFYISRTTLH